jgi:hypothetical protein
MKAALALLLPLGACSGPREEESPMAMSTAGAPPIDREAPAQLETATFALG